MRRSLGHVGAYSFGWHGCSLGTNELNEQAHSFFLAVTVLSRCLVVPLKMSLRMGISQPAKPLWPVLHHSKETHQTFRVQQLP